MRQIVRVQETKPVNLPEFESAELKAAVVVMSALLFQLQKNVMSSDIWKICLLNTQKHALEMGLTQEEFEAIMMKLEESRLRERSKNPMSRMY